MLVDSATSTKNCFSIGILLDKICKIWVAWTTADTFCEQSVNLLVKSSAVQEKSLKQLQVCPEPLFYFVIENSVHMQKSSSRYLHTTPLIKWERSSSKQV